MAKDKNIVVVDGVSFYKDAWAGKSLKEFQDHEAHHGFDPKVMKEIFSKVNPDGPAAAEDKSTKGK